MMMELRAGVTFVVVCWVALASVTIRVHAQGNAGDVPATEEKPVADEYHGTSVSEDFRWLEEGQSPLVKKWSNKQNGYARSILDHLPGVPKLRQQITQILSAKTVGYGSVSLVGEKCFAIKKEPPRQQPFIVVMNSVDDVSGARIVVDPNKLDSSGTTSIDWYKVSPNGKWLAVSLSSGGSEVGNLTLYEVETGKTISSDRIDYVNSGTAGGSLAWFPDSTGFFYTRHFKVAPDNPNDQNVYQHVYRHRLGESVANDQYELGK
ncbi:S9 family peptidase, partial [bacterium]|nr:S9 family peptidase [bacterium]